MKLVFACLFIKQCRDYQTNDIKLGEHLHASRANSPRQHLIICRLRPKASDRCQCEFTSVPLKPSPHKKGRKNKNGLLTLTINRKITQRL